MSAQDSKKSKKAKIREIINKYRKAGEISIEAKKLVKQLIKPGVNVFKAGEKVEKLIRSKGAKPAFPINISINNEAAHYSPEILDERVIPDNSIVKVDLGAQIDGYIVDTAITLNFNSELDDLAKASKDALDAVIAVAKPGIKLSDIGKLVEKIINQAGYVPVKNLSGHQIKRYNLHAGVSIPNCGPGTFERAKGRLKPGRIYAIEPFASSGKGLVKNGSHTNIFRFVKAPPKNRKQLVEIAIKYKKEVGVLPFSPRHLYEGGGEKEKEEITRNLKKLLSANVIMGYPVLIDEKKEGMVSQFEHTLRITRDGCEVLTSNNY